MVTEKKAGRWSDVKRRLDGCDRQGLIGLVRDLYEASATNRRFLHARYVPSVRVLEDYRQLVSDAVAPDPFSQRPTRLRDATAAITEYRRSTGDVAGTIELMLAFVEAGTAQVLDLGCDDEGYYSALERKIRDVVRALGELSDEGRAAATARLVKLAEHSNEIGWGYGDFLGDVAAELEAQRAVQVVGATRSNTRWSRRAAEERRRAAHR